MANALPTADDFFKKKDSASLPTADAFFKADAPNFLPKKPPAIGEIKKITNNIRGRDESVDYDTGLPVTSDIGFERADNDAERKTALEKSFPGQKIDRDGEGNFYVTTKDGKKIAAGTGGEFFAHDVPVFMGSHAESLLGMGEGAEAGGIVGGPLGAMVGAAVGGVSGKSLQELEKMTTGYWNKKNMKEELDTLTSEAGWSALGEGTGKFILGLGRAARRMPKVLGEQTAETDALVKKSLDLGAQPPLAAAAPGATKSQYVQTFIEKVIGNHRENKNATVLQKQIFDRLAQSGFSQPEAEKSFQQLVDGKIDSRAYGEEMVKNVNDYIKTQETAVKDLNKNMDKILDSQFKAINQSIGSPKPDLAGLIKEDIQTARETFSHASSALYGKVDALAGNSALVPTDSIKREVESIMEKLPTTKNGEKVIAPGAENVVKYFKSIADLPDNLSFRQAQFLRSEFNRMALSTDLTPGVDKKLFRQMGSVMDKSFNEARIGKITGAASDALKQADDFYRTNIKKFKNTMAAKLVKDAGEKGAVDPESVISLIAKPGYASRLDYIMKMVSPETKKAITAEDFSQLMKKSTDYKGAVNSKALLKQITEREKTGKALYGKDFNSIKEYATRLAAKDGVIPASSLNPDSFSAALKDAVAKQDTLDSFLSRGDNYLATMAKGDFEFGNAVNFVIQPGKEERLAKAIDFFKNKPDIVQNLRKQALVKIFGDAAGGSQESLLKSLSSPALEKELGKYTDRQLKMLFPNGLDQELKDMAKVTKFYSQDSAKDKMAAGLAAGGVKLLPLPTYLPIAALLYAGDAILKQPKVIRWFGPGLYGDNFATKGMRTVFKNVPRAMIQSNAGDPEDDAQ